MVDEKITDLTALTGANLATGDLFTLVDVSDTTMAATGTNKKITADELRIGIKGARSVSDTHTDTSAVNTTTETVVASQAIPTTVAAGDLVRLTAIGDLLNSSAGTVTYTAKAIIGATAAITSAAGSTTSNAARRQWRIDIDVLVVATNDQRVSVESALTPLATSGWTLTAATTSGVSRGTATEDLTAGKNLQLSITMSVANASADFVCHESWLEVIKR